MSRENKATIPSRRMRIVGGNATRNKQLAKAFLQLGWHVDARSPRDAQANEPNYDIVVLDAGQDFSSKQIEQTIRRLKEPATSPFTVVLNDPKRSSSVIDDADLTLEKTADVSKDAESVTIAFLNWQHATLNERLGSIVRRHEELHARDKDRAEKFALFSLTSTLLLGVVGFGLYSTCQLSSKKWLAMCALVLCFTVVGEYQIASRLGLSDWGPFRWLANHRGEIFVALILALLWAVVIGAVLPGEGSAADSGQAEQHFGGKPNIIPGQR